MEYYKILPDRGTKGGSQNFVWLLIEFGFYAKKNEEPGKI